MILANICNNFDDSGESCDSGVFAEFGDLVINMTLLNMVNLVDLVILIILVNLAILVILTILVNMVIFLW